MLPNKYVPGGGDKLSELISVPLTTERIASSVIVIVLDLSVVKPFGQISASKLIATHLNFIYPPLPIHLLCFPLESFPVCRIAPPQPGNVLPSLVAWLERVRSRVNECIKQLRNSDQVFVCVCLMFMPA